MHRINKIKEVKRNSLNIDYTSIILKLRHIVVLLFFDSRHSLIRRNRAQCHRLLGLCSSLRMSPSMSNGKKLLSLEICYERNTTFWLWRSSQILLKLRVLRLKKHGNLIALLFLQIGSLFRAVRSWMTVLPTNSALDGYMSFCLERAGPSSMSFLLAILTIVIINSLYLKIVAIEQVL